MHANNLNQHERSHITMALLRSVDCLLSYAETAFASTAFDRTAEAHGVDLLNDALEQALLRIDMHGATYNAIPEPIAKFIGPQVRN